MDKRLTFRYGRALVLSRTMLYGVAVALIAVFLALTPNLPPELAVLFLGLLAAIFLVFAVSPLFTAHWVTRSRIILHQGWYFRTILPLADLESLAAGDELTPGRTPLGIQRPLGYPTLYVTGGRTGLVVAKLTHPRRFWQAFGLSVDEIVFDVADRDAFLAAVDERRRLLAPIQAERADT